MLVIGDLQPLIRLSNLKDLRESEAGRGQRFYRQHAGHAE